ncbi:hypothetical protein NY08_2737 [Rhodococcus sp. B7740]|nr:hypothetical protein NY08_2737 [Rhodococcus sp. B7740]
MTRCCSAPGLCGVRPGDCTNDWWRSCFVAVSTARQKRRSEFLSPQPGVSP